MYAFQEIRGIKAILKEVKPDFLMKLVVTFGLRSAILYGAGLIKVD